jgi:ribokinase/sulfofructose kinase
LLDTVVARSAATRPALVFDLSGPVTELVGRGTTPETIHGYVHHADLFVAGGVATPAYFRSDAAAVERLRQIRTADVETVVFTHCPERMTAITKE